MPNLTNTPKIINKIGDKVNASDLGRVAFTNQYSDLDGIPAQTVVNNATVTFKKNGTTVQTITNNQALDAEVNYELTKVDVGLGNVDNTADINKPVSNAVNIELSKKANKTDVYTKAETDAAISSTVSSVYKYKGSVNRYADLPIEGQTIGDVYNVRDAYHSYPADTNFAWDGSDWDALGGTVDLSTYLTKTEAANTYLTNSNAAALYLSKIEAGSTYLSKTDAASTYATKNELSDAVENVDGISTTQPQNPEAGSVYYDTTENVLKVYNGVEWINVGSGDVTFEPFPNGFNTTGTTQQFLRSIELMNLPVGSAYLGQVSLSDMPDGVTIQGDVEVYVYPQNVIYAIMRSAEVPPYIWEVNSYEYRGWETVSGITTSSSQPTNPSVGQLWYDSATGKLKIYNGTSWVVVGEGQDHVVLTRQEYNALTPAEKFDPTKIYLIKGQGSSITVYWNDIVGKPTSLSEFTNDTGFITSSSLPTKVSDLTNDSGFQTSSDVNSAINTAVSGLSIPTNVSDLNNDSGYQTASDVSSAISSAVDLSNYLAKNNTTSYTPSGDYNPATKKYVDDIVGNINTLLSNI